MLAVQHGLVVKDKLDRTLGPVLAFDFGTKRIGVAVGEKAIGVAHPLKTIEGEANAVRFASVTALVGEWRPSLLLVGLPLSLEGKHQQMTARCQRFANQLKGRFQLPVCLVDERLSSVAATEILRSMGTETGRRKERVDAVSAQLILQSYFDSGDAVLDPPNPRSA